MICRRCDLAKIIQNAFAATRSSLTQTVRKKVFFTNCMFSHKIAHSFIKQIPYCNDLILLFCRICVIINPDSLDSGFFHEM
jgi:hypothetical protein